MFFMIVFALFVSKTFGAGADVVDRVDILTSLSFALRSRLLFPPYSLLKPSFPNPTLGALFRGGRGQ
jgi:hypothetical protein